MGAHLPVYYGGIDPVELQTIEARSTQPSPVTVPGLPTLQKVPGWEIHTRFSQAELVDICYTLPTIPHDWTRALEGLPSTALALKIRASCWHRGQQRPALTTYQKIVTFLKAFRLDAEGFSHKVDFTHRTQDRMGYARKTGAFLDGEIGLIVYYKGQHAITTSFDVIQNQRNSIVTIRLRQIQLKEKRGNRFLFKLQPHYIEHIAWAYAAAAHSAGVRLAFPTGNQAAQTLLDIYGKIEAQLITPPEENLAGWDEHKEAELAKIKFAKDVTAPRLRRLYRIPFKTLVARGHSLRGHRGYISLKLKAPYQQTRLPEPQQIAA